MCANNIEFVPAPGEFDVILSIGVPTPIYRSMKLQEQIVRMFANSARMKLADVSCRLKTVVKL